MSNEGFSMIGDMAKPSQKWAKPTVETVALPQAEVQSRVETVEVAVPAPPMKKIQRNMRGLIEALFDEIDALRDGTGSPERLKAVCGVTSSIAGLMNTEMKFIKMAAGDEKMSERVKTITG